MAVEMYNWSPYTYSLSTGAIPTPVLSANVINTIREDDWALFNDIAVTHIIVYGVPEGGSAYIVGANKNQQAGRLRAQGFASEAGCIAQLKSDVNNIIGVYYRP
jgi:hypothetical protein